MRDTLAIVVLVVVVAVGMTVGDDIEEVMNNPGAVVTTCAWDPALVCEGEEAR